MIIIIIVEMQTHDWNVCRMVQSLVIELND